MEAWAALDRVRLARSQAVRRLQSSREEVNIYSAQNQADVSTRREYAVTPNCFLVQCSNTTGNNCFLLQEPAHAWACLS
jgi:hypothetical protein